MSFITTSPVAAADEAEISSNGFYPNVDPAKVRESQRIDGTVTTQRLRDALIEAIATVNAETEAWRLLREAEGYATLAEVPAPVIDEISINTHRYQRAVGCLAKATLIERYRDYDSTGSGNKKADELETPLDDQRRDARWAINDIIGLSRTTIALI